MQNEDIYTYVFVYGPLALALLALIIAARANRRATIALSTIRQMAEHVRAAITSVELLLELEEQKKAARPPPPPPPPDTDVRMGAGLVRPAVRPHPSRPFPL